MHEPGQGGRQDRFVIVDLCGSERVRPIEEVLAPALHRRPEDSWVAGEWISVGTVVE